MILTDIHIEEIKAAAASIDFGSVTIKPVTENCIDIIVEKRKRLTVETAQTARRPPLLAGTRQSPGKPRIGSGG